MPNLRKAELIEGIVYMPAAVRFKSHSQPHGWSVAWLGTYEVMTPGVALGVEPTVRLDIDNEPQPDAVLLVAELEYGVAKSQQQEKNRTALLQFLLPLEIVEFNQAAATIYGTIRSKLESRGLIIGAMDMLIASHALSLGVTLVTNNVREFSRIPTLSLKNWVE